MVVELSEIILKYSIFSHGTILFRVEEQIKQNMGTIGKIYKICFLFFSDCHLYHASELCKLFQNRWLLKFCSIFSFNALYTVIMVVSKSDIGLGQQNREI